MANPISQVQGTVREFRVTFISQEKLGVLFIRVLSLQSFNTKRERAAETKWLDNTLRRLGLVPSGPNWSTYAIATGSDFSGNYGAFILQEPVDTTE